MIGDNGQAGSAGRAASARLGRRTFLKAAGAAAVTGAAANLLSATRSLANTAARSARAAATPLQHVIIDCQENRSFDHYYGFAPFAGPAGVPLGYSQPDGAGPWRRTSSPACRRRISAIPTTRSTATDRGTTSSSTRPGTARSRFCAAPSRRTGRWSWWAAGTAAAACSAADDGAPIADLGCGPGHVAAWLADRGVAAVGIDLSPAMIAVGRRGYPNVDFREADFLELPAADGEFAAAIAFYSIIHLQPGELAQAFGEIHRVLRPGGLFLVAFHIGSEVRHLDEWWGHPVDVDLRFFEPPEIANAIDRAGFCTEMRLERVSYPGEVETRRAYLLARRRA